MILATEFTKLHNKSEAWLYVKKRTHPEGFYTIDGRLYVEPKEVWFRDKAINMMYHPEYYEKVEGLYYELTDIYAEYMLAGLIALVSTRNKDNWYMFMRSFMFPRGERTDEFIKICELISTLIGKYGEDYEVIKAELMTISNNKL